MESVTPVASTASDFLNIVSVDGHPLERQFFTKPEATLNRIAEDIKRMRKCGGPVHFSEDGRLAIGGEDFNRIVDGAERVAKTNERAHVNFV